ncbi:MAG: hypothetical protein E6J91_37680 [Deltaproteobacteria bacterium]|nr:MAG: hypothetical protein E6J91_37680 [Deltaproteobacteria bacterium]
MSAVPAEIAGIGSTQQKLRVSPGFDPLKAAVGPQEYFVLSRIDGLQTLRDVLLATGLPVDRAISIVQRLRAIGALLIPGETAAPVAAAPPPPTPPPPELRKSAPPAPAAPAASPPSRTSGAVPVIRSAAAGSAPAGASPRRTTGPLPVHPDPEHDLTLPRATPAELAALREDIPLDDRTRRLILAMARLADGRDPWALLGVPAGAEPRQLKRAYFKLSKEIHPDRYYGERLGSFTDRLPFVFEAVSRAYARLTSPDRRAAAPAVDRAEQPQTPQEYAVELFDRACQLEIVGEHLRAFCVAPRAARSPPDSRAARSSMRRRLTRSHPPIRRRRASWLPHFAPPASCPTPRKC